ncbi:hypothetical protein DIPPA_04453 [Diplonema papillatum]|nr:hypothetical protein DIPPA_04453 [Diplonema papillatum]
MQRWQKPHPYARGAQRLDGRGTLIPRKVQAALQEAPLYPPLILPAGGPCVDGEAVAIENQTGCEECAIFYTTDGSTPTIHSAVYRGPFRIHPPHPPQAAVRAVSAASVARVSEPATEIFRFTNLLPSRVDRTTSVTDPSPRTPPADRHLSDTASSPVNDGGGRRPPFASQHQAPEVTVATTTAPPAIVATCEPVTGGAPLRVFYRLDRGSWTPLPASGQLTLALDEEPHMYSFIASEAADAAAVEPSKSSVSYLYVPVKPRWTGAVDITFVLDQAVKWLWEVYSRIPLIRDQWQRFGFSAEVFDLLQCVNKLESALFLALCHLSPGKVVYEGQEISVVEGQTVALRHFQEAVATVLTLYYSILDVQRGADDQTTQKMLEAMKIALYKVRLMAALVPTGPPDAAGSPARSDPGANAPAWLDRIREEAASLDPSSSANVRERGAGVVAACEGHAGVWPEHADGLRRIVAALCGEMDGLRAENDDLRAQLHQAKVDADELRNNVDTQLAWINAARLREAKLEAIVGELRNQAGQHAPAAPVHVVGTDSHLAFLLSPDT